MRALTSLRVLLPLVLACATPKEVQRAAAPQPLVGTVWDAAHGKRTDLGTLEREARDATFVLLGETHDNPAHHRLQAELVRAVASGGRRPAIAFEMLDASQQPAVDAAQKDEKATPDSLADAVKWSEGGWPDFALYRPIFAEALERKLPLVAANLPKPVVKDTVKQGASALPAALRARLEQAPPLPPEVEAELREEMKESHCGKLPDAMLAPMLVAQRARDAQMADRLLGADTGAGAVLIAGAGHVRSDVGVAALLRREGKRALSVAFVEVQPDKPEPSQYAPLPYDFVVFTEAQPREDPCAAMVAPQR